MKQISRTIAVALALAAASTASASIVATLTFTQQAGVVTNTEAIPIYVTLTLDPTSDPIVTDASGNVTSLLAADIDANLLPGVSGLSLSSANMTNSNTNEGLSCAGTFFTGCGGNPYDFNFAADFLVLTNTTLAPGSSTTYLFGTLTPTGGVAPAGTYALDTVDYFIQVWDNNLDDSLRDPSSSGQLHLADVPIATSSNTFERTVVSTPEPGASTIFAGGMVLLWAVSRLRVKNVKAYLPKV